MASAAAQRKPVRGFLILVFGFNSPSLELQLKALGIKMA
jgi:hypothetical protein